MFVYIMGSLGGILGLQRPLTHSRTPPHALLSAPERTMKYPKFATLASDRPRSVTARHAARARSRVRTARLDTGPTHSCIGKTRPGRVKVAF